MEIEFPKRTDVLGRIAAQTAKQVIFQKVREAERENIFAEYNQRVGEVINSMVKRFENGDLIVEIGRVEAVLPRKEQSRAESYTPGERIRAVIKGVNRSAKGPQIVLSRTDPALLIKLFEQEVPEIYDGTVMIRGAVREAGDRAKVAVYSRERDVDPVGACVGMKGTRVQAIIRELRGEKIDIVEWSDDPILFVTNALSPAKVQRVSIVDDEDRVMEVVVEDKQLSLAIGKKGQNVRLAAKLTGWRIDIKSEEEKRREVEAQFGALELGERTATSRGDAVRRGRRQSGCGRRDAVADGERGGASARVGGRGCHGDESARMREAPAETVTEDRVRRRNQFGNGSDLQGRGAARHDQPGSARAAQARSRHRAEERVEHARGGRRALVRRARGAPAQHLAARRRHVRRDARAAGKGRQEGARPPRRPRAAEAGRPGARTAAPGQDVRPATPRAGSAGRRNRTRPSRRCRGTAGGSRRRRLSSNRSRPPPVAEAAADRRAARRGARRRASRNRVAEAARRPRTPPGRFVPPTLRLRIEEPGQTPQPARPLAPAKRPQASQPRMVAKPAATPPPGAKPAAPATAAKAGTPGAARRARRARVRRVSAAAAADDAGHAWRTASAAVAARAHAAARTATSRHAAAAAAVSAAPAVRAAAARPAAGHDAGASGRRRRRCRPRPPRRRRSRAPSRSPKA